MLPTNDSLCWTNDSVGFTVAEIKIATNANPAVNDSVMVQVGAGAADVLYVLVSYSKSMTFLVG